MKKLNLFITLITFAMLQCCNEVSQEKESKTDETFYSEIEKANWFLGKWQGISAEGTATEIWQKLNDSTFTGESYFVVGKDTVSAEKLMLTENGGKLYYIPTVSSQNNGQPVKFVLTSESNNQMIFENPAHDFPQKISYSSINNDSIVAEISGKMNGKENMQQFPMKRVK